MEAHGMRAIDETMRRQRREPVCLTVADLATLVNGSAFAISLPVIHFPSDRIAISNIPMPGWVPWLFAIGEVAMKLCLALTPVIVARRARYGGLASPAEWLAIAGGLTFLLEFISRAGWLQRIARWYFVDVRSMLGHAVVATWRDRPVELAHRDTARWVGTRATCSSTALRQL
jgi:hypothetical protein